jgi:hypothetical protein
VRGVIVHDQMQLPAAVGRVGECRTPDTHERQAKWAAVTRQTGAERGVWVVCKSPRTRLIKLLAAAIPRVRHAGHDPQVNGMGVQIPVLRRRGKLQRGRHSASVHDGRDGSFGGRRQWLHLRMRVWLVRCDRHGRRVGQDGRHVVAREIAPLMLAVGVSA